MAVEKPQSSSTGGDRPLRGGTEDGERARGVDPATAGAGGTPGVRAPSGDVHLPPPGQTGPNTGMADRPTEDTQPLSGGKTPEQVLRYFEGVEFPANKEDLIRAARRHGAGDDVLADLTVLPAGHYANSDEVIRDYPRLPEGSEV